MKSKQQLQDELVTALQRGDNQAVIRLLLEMDPSDRSDILQILKNSAKHPNKTTAKHPIEAKIDKELQENAEFVSTQIKSLMEAIKGKDIELVRQITEQLTPEELVVQNASIGAPIKLAVITGQAEIAHVLLTKNPKLLSIDNIISKEEQEAELFDVNILTNKKIDIFYKGCSDVMLKALLEFDSLALDLLVQHKKDQAALDTIKLNPKVLRVLIEEKSNNTLERVLEIIKNAEDKDVNYIFSGASKDGKSLLHFAYEQQNFVAKNILVRLFYEAFDNENDQLATQYYENMHSLSAHLEQINYLLNHPDYMGHADMPDFYEKTIDWVNLEDQVKEQDTEPRFTELSGDSDTDSVNGG